ncbi:hypothetical protein D4740_05880 [Actinomyces sp. 2119]|uniref:hypothetical protein n=1 Tax=Actinomyces sp. 2119 TaxID=2321393 RepID=UPI000E6B50C6|nr:hypothetical protein [Actinomyces sp. 2119]RJF42480.1 hypothetical protein D4740_05880 [Actinomyces sp. 2119]
MDRFIEMVNNDQTNNKIPTASDDFCDQGVMPMTATPVAARAAVATSRAVARTVTRRAVRRTQRGLPFPV